MSLPSCLPDERKEEEDAAAVSPLVEKAREVFSDAFSAWGRLLPSAMKCGGSVAGCDFCLYFFATYNVSAHPNVCVGGCSLSTVGSCTSLIGTSITETYNLIRKQDEED